MRSYALILLFMVAVVLAFASPFIGLLSWTSIVYVNPQHYVWGFGSGIRYVMIIAVVTIVSTVYHRAASRVDMTSSVIFFFLLVIWVSLTTIFAINTEDAFDIYIEIIKLFMLTIMTALLVNDPKKMNIFLAVLVGSIAFFGVKGGIFGILSGGNQLVFGPPNSFIYANNAIALALIMMIPLLWYFSGAFQSVYVRIASTAAIFLCTISILISYSRGALLGIGAMLFYWVMTSRHKAAGIVTMVAVGVFALAFMPEEWMARMESIENYEEDGSAQSRLAMWGFAIEVAKDRLFGGGFGIFSMYDLYEQYGLDLDRIGYTARSAHSIYFETLGQHGFIGLFLFLGFWFSVFRLLGRIRKAPDTDPQFVRLAFAIQASLVGYAVGGAFLNKAFEWPIAYQLAAVALVLQRLAKEQRVRAEGVNESAPETGASTRPIPVGARRKKAVLSSTGGGRRLRPILRKRLSPEASDR